MYRIPCPRCSRLILVFTSWHKGLWYLVECDCGHTFRHYDDPARR